MNFHRPMKRLHWNMWTIYHISRRNQAVASLGLSSRVMQNKPFVLYGLIESHPCLWRDWMSLSWLPACTWGGVSPTWWSLSLARYLKSYHSHLQLCDYYIVCEQALSKHPFISAWPKVAVTELNKTLHHNGEIAFYEAAVENLNRRIGALKRSGYPFEERVDTLRRLRARVTQVRRAFFFSECWCNCFITFVTSTACPHKH